MSRHIFLRPVDSCIIIFPISVFAYYKYILITRKVRKVSSIRIHLYVSLLSPLSQVAKSLSGKLISAFLPVSAYFFPFLNLLRACQVSSSGHSSLFELISAVFSVVLPPLRGFASHNPRPKAGFLRVHTHGSLPGFLLQSRACSIRRFHA